MVSSWDNYLCYSVYEASLKYSLGLSIILLSPLEWILMENLEEGEIDMSDKQGRKSQKNKASNVEERRETAEISRGTNKWNLWVPPSRKQNWDNPALKCKFAGNSDWIFSFPSCCSLKYLDPWSNCKDPKPCYRHNWKLRHSIPGQASPLHIPWNVEGKKSDIPWLQIEFTDTFQAKAIFQVVILLLNKFPLPFTLLCKTCPFLVSKWNKSWNIREKSESNFVKCY